MSTLTQLKGARDLALLNHFSHKSEQSQAALDKAESDLKAAIVAAEAGEVSTDDPDAIKQQAHQAMKAAVQENSPAPKPAPVNTLPAPPAPKIEPAKPETNQPGDTTNQDGGQPADTTNNGDSGQSEEKKSE
ncbi:hypothetical protein [Spirosoma oryzicola]|uniref:hypothetical protein n=1 Tax=Spirosoma oryzicola TaxID=2898794 RepID=UPI001E3E78F6|nr:hypothetical protein [Spirosoma oryzicola]UHG93367.1 hypothetical protein LQ777_10790 [Spirosoma oryzicola]